MIKRTVLERVARIAVFALIASAGFAHASGAGTERDQEHQLKAALITKLIPFIDWPSLGPAGSKFVVGVYDADEYQGAIEEAFSTSSTSSFLGHPIVVIQLHSDADVKKCRMVVTGASSEDRIYRLSRLCEGAGTVLVGDSDDFARNGGTVGLLLIASKVKFDLNLDTAKRSGVTISAKLIGIAHEKFREGPE